MATNTGDGTVVASMPGSTPAPAATVPPELAFTLDPRYQELPEAEQKRRQTIAANQRKLQQLHVQLSATVQEAAAKTAQLQGGSPSTRNNRRRNTSTRRRHAAVAPTSLRRSKRTRGVAPSGEPGVDSSAALKELPPEPEPEVLHLAEPYFRERGITPKIYSNGHYSGWVAPDVMTKFGIASNATEAWESNGGGRFTYRDPSGRGKKSRSSAKDVAATMLRKNPNSYFYRHTAPGVAQHFGDWTPEEHDLFVSTATAFGCGDKWGLFSSYIPHRVGYQCSAYYRQAILKEGIAVDDNYRINAHGEAVFTGEGKKDGGRKRGGGEATDSGPTAASPGRGTAAHKPGAAAADAVAVGGAGSVGSAGAGAGVGAGVGVGVGDGSPACAGASDGCDGAAHDNKLE